MIPSPRHNTDFNSHEWQDWFFQLVQAINSLSTTGSGGGMLSTTKIVNAYSVASYTPSYGNYVTTGLASVLSGALTAGVEKNVMSITGKGSYPFLIIKKPSGVNSTVTVRLNIDGIDVFNYTSGVGVWIVGSNPYITLAGMERMSNTSPIVSIPIYYNVSCDLFITSNQTETDTFSIYYLRNEN